MTFGADPNKAITMAVRSFLQTAAKEPSIKRFVLTSSNRAAANPTVNEDVTIDANHRNEEAVESAWPYPLRGGSHLKCHVYASLKAQCEQEIWKFNREEKPGFVINTPGSSGKWVMDFWKDSGHYMPLQQFGPSWYSDTEDTALLHIAALTQEDVKNERLFGWPGTFNFNSWVDVFRQIDPSKPWPADDSAQGHDLCKVDTRYHQRVGIAEAIRTGRLDKLL
ncbi:hypothetical protein V1517DRAFT_309428 [Lipomyces orientalis]|uniref:Uncharacterized protein n=1 Tax=Lipomyces orientalis TaxID=1233043 RepID=A0ACC3TIA5_9ASCO